jgi:hypothetical protein
MIIGINLNSIKAENSEKQVEGAINVNSAPSIDHVEEKQIDGKNVLGIKFTFITSYKPEDGLEVGKAEIKGEVLYQSDKNKELLDVWNKNKKLDKDVSVQILNAVFRRCLIEIIHLSAVLRLPPPIQFPVVKVPEEAKDKVSSDSDRYKGVEKTLDKKDDDSKKDYVG